MFIPLYDFGKAYQAELVRIQQAEKIKRNRVMKMFSIRFHIQTVLGNVLIHMGERIKGETGCIEIPQGSV